MQISQGDNKHDCCCHLLDINKTIDFIYFKEKRNQFNQLLNSLRAKEHKGNSKSLFEIINSSLKRKAGSPFPPHLDDKTLATEFGDLFLNRRLKPLDPS